MLFEPDEFAERGHGLDGCAGLLVDVAGSGGGSEGGGGVVAAGVGPGE